MSQPPEHEPIVPVGSGPASNSGHANDSAGDRRCRDGHCLKALPHGTVYCGAYRSRPRSLVAWWLLKPTLEQMLIDLDGLDRQPGQLDRDPELTAHSDLWAQGPVGCRATARAFVQHPLWRRPPDPAPLCSAGVRKPPRPAGGSRLDLCGQGSSRRQALPGLTLSARTAARDNAAVRQLAARGRRLC